MEKKVFKCIFTELNIKRTVAIIIKFFFLTHSICEEYRITKNVYTHNILHYLKSISNASCLNVRSIVNDKANKTSFCQMNPFVEVTLIFSVSNSQQIFANEAIEFRVVGSPGRN